MNDLEMTRLAAESIGIDLLCLEGFLEVASDHSYFINEKERYGFYNTYSPLTDAAQAFELMEKLRMDIEHSVCGTCRALKPDVHGGCLAQSVWSDDLKRALVECAANYALWKRKEGN